MTRLLLQASLNPPGWNRHRGIKHPCNQSAGQPFFHRTDEGEIESVQIDLAGNRRELFKDELRRRSVVRVRHDPQFQDIAKDVQQLNERLKADRLSLNETTRRTERAKDIKRKEKEEAERGDAEHADQSKTYELTLAHVNKRQLPLLGRVCKSCLMDKAPTCR